jgi:betaine-aldehyde dehydrogenase
VLESRNNGKPLSDALGEVAEAADVFAYYADMAARVDVVSTVALPDERFETRVVSVPVGVVGAIAPFNYPILMAAWQVAPALAAGCTCVLKPSELTPVSAVEGTVRCKDKKHLFFSSLRSCSCCVGCWFSARCF